MIFELGGVLYVAFRIWEMEKKLKKSQFILHAKWMPLNLFYMQQTTSEFSRALQKIYTDSVCSYRRRNLSEQIIA